jgi:DNA-binding PadR family transcriptional regulator
MRLTDLTTRIVIRFPDGQGQGTIGSIPETLYVAGDAEVCHAPFAFVIVLNVTPVTGLSRRRVVSQSITLGDTSPREQDEPMVQGRRRRVEDEQVRSLGRYADPAVLILASLGDGPKHGYALLKDIERFAAVSLGPGTLYGALARLEQGHLIEPLPSDDRRHPYRITGAGAAALAEHLASMEQVVATARERLRARPA